METCPKRSFSNFEVYNDWQSRITLKFGKTASKYLDELRKNFEYIAQDYAMSHTDKAQRRYISRYNLRAREKSFEIGQTVLVFTPDPTSSKTFSRWVGPAVIKDKLSNHSYLVDINGAVKHILTSSENITFKSMRSL